MKHLLLAALIVFLPAFAAAGDLPPADLKKLHDCTLSMDKIKAMQAVMDDLKRAQADPILKGQSQRIVDDSQSLAQM